MGSYNDDGIGLDLGLDPVFTPALYVDPTEPDIKTLLARNPLTPWPIKLPTELALGGEPLETTLARNDSTIDDYARWALMPAFRKALADAAKEIRENGSTFRGLCRSIAEDWLSELDTALHNPVIQFTSKLDAFKTLTKLAGLEPKEEKVQPNAGNMVNIQINL